MYDILGLFKIWHPSVFVTVILSDIIMWVMTFSLYNVAVMFVYRYCQTVGNNFYYFLSGKKCIPLHIVAMIFAGLLMVPTNEVSEQELQEYKAQLDPAILEMVKDYAFYGLRVSLCSRLSI